MITYLKDVRQIANQFEEVIKYSQGLSEAKYCKNYIVDWLKNKKYFIKKLGGFIYEVPEPITVELSQTTKEEKVKDFAWWVEKKYHNSDLVDFILDNKDTFYDNRVSKSHRKEINEGMKLLKSFKFFVDEDKKEDLNEIQSRASMLIQEDKVTGRLCFSVHPLDFLSSSENTYKWHSCHALDSSYRAGNLSYMVDNCTIMCYLRSDEEQELPHFPADIPWNSKKWRMLLHFSDTRTMVFAGRPYPYEINSILDKIRDIIEELGLVILTESSFFWMTPTLSPWSKKYITSVKTEVGTLELASPYMVLPEDLLKKKSSVVKDGKHSCHFNDLLYSSYYTPYYMYTMLQWGTDGAPQGPQPHFIVGGKTYCVYCGNTGIEKGGDSMLCEVCHREYGDNSDFIYCDCCGSSYPEEDMYFVNGEAFCPDCYDTEVLSCEHCGREFYRTELTYEEESEMYLCDDCLDLERGEV